jgi:hypothetical protein
MKDEIASMSVGTGTHCGRSSLFCLSRQDERMDVNGSGNPGFISQGHGIFGNGFGPFNGLLFQGIKSFDFKVDFV